MLDYEWGNPSSMMLSTGDEPTSQDSDPTRTIFDHYSQTFNDSFLQTPSSYTQHHHHHLLQAQAPVPAHFNPLYDPRAYNAACASTYQANVVPNPSSMLTLERNPGPAEYMVKTEPVAGVGVDFASRIGLNLGGRTYFSSSEDDFVNRLYRRSRPLEAGLVNAPRCQVEGCNADLTHAKHYHRRHKVCEFHSKVSTVIAAGLTQRFCQQCSRFHLLTEFDNGKRSCRKRLADHNRRRRKASQQQNQQDQSKSHHSTSQNATSETLTRSPPDLGAQSSSSVTIAISPPRISLDCFRQRSYQATATTTTTTTTSTSSASTGSLFY